MDTFKIIFRISLMHDFYKDRKCRGIDMNLTDETRQLFNRRGILFRAIGIGEWALISVNDPSPDISDELSLVLKVRDSDFFYYTESSDVLKNISRGKIVIPFQFAGTDNMVLYFQARKVYWVYKFISRRKNEERKLEIKSTDKNFTFKKVEFIEKENSYYCCSETKIRLKESYDFRLSLTENISLGGDLHTTETKVLISGMPFPKPGRIYTDDIHCIQEIIYI